MWQDFFFLRPWWLLALLPAAVLLILAYRRINKGSQGGWKHLVDPHLLKSLSVKETEAPRSSKSLLALGLSLLFAIIAMSGPSWEKNNVPAFSSKTPNVVVMSLAQSMNATDIKPSRLTRAGHKLRDILKRLDGGDVGLVIYADRPFVAAPLTSDMKVIEQMLPELSTNLMPVLGNRLDLAIAQASKTLQQAGARGGNIIVLADDAGKRLDAATAAARKARQQGYHVSVIGIGTAEGAPLQTASGQQITRQGKVLTAGYAKADLQAVAGAGGGHFAPLSADAKDIDSVLSTSQSADSALTMPGDGSKQQHSLIRVDDGYWFLFVPLVLLPLAFRKNVLMMAPVLLAVSLAMPVKEAQAADLSWSDLWQTPDQQAASEFAAGHYPSAAKQFEQPDWRASADYRAGNYQAAANAYAASNDKHSGFNRANALAKSGKLQQALQSYDDYLKTNLDDEDAKFNRELVAKLLQQQKQQNGKSNQKGEQSEQDNGQSNQKGEQSEQDSGQSNQKGEQSGQDNGQSNQKGEQSSQDSGQSKQNGQSAKQDAQSKSADNVAGAKESQEQANASPGKTPRPDDQTQQQAVNKKPGEQVANQSSNQAADQTEKDKRGAEFSQAMDRAMDRALSQTDDRPRHTQPQGVAGAISEHDQMNEQLLRSVPDDASGLLRARIRQYYQR